MTAGLAIGVVATVGVPAFATSPPPDRPVTATATTSGSAWSALATPKARGSELGRLVTAELHSAGVPVPVVEVTDIGAALGQFDPAAWVLHLSLPALASLRPVPSSSEARALVATAHHEVRHVEQWFRMAQLRAGDGRSADAISAEMALPRAVAVAAVARPLGPADEGAAAARNWWNSVYGPGQEHRNRALAAVLSAKAAYDAAARSYRAEPSPTAGALLLQADEALDGPYAAYRNLPEEADAFSAQADRSDRP